jgi:hypothetical protein
MLSSLTSFVEPIGIAPIGILAVLSVLVIAGLVAGIYQEAKLRNASQRRRSPRATNDGSDKNEIHVRNGPDARAGGGWESG